MVSPGKPKVNRIEEENKPVKAAEKELPGKWEEKHECDVLESKRRKCFKEGKVFSRYVTSDSLRPHGL